DRVEALRDGAAPLDVRLLDADDLEIATPVTRFVRRPRAGHAAADDEDVRIDVDRLPSAEKSHYTSPSLKRLLASVGSPPSILSEVGSFASDWSARLGAGGASASCGAGIDPHGVVRIGDSKFFSRPSRKTIFHETVPFSGSRSTRTLWPSGAKSA